MDGVKSKIGPKACTTCAKAKARCNPGPTEGICERCHRLSKSCAAQTPAPPRKRKAPKPTRVAELEKRLENLTARVESRQQLPLPLSEMDSPLNVEDPPRKICKFGVQDHKAADHRRTAYSHIFPGYQNEQLERAANTQNHHYQNERVPEEETANAHAVDQGEWPLTEPTQSQRSQTASNSSPTLSTTADNDDGTSRNPRSRSRTQVPEIHHSPLRSGGTSLAQSGEPWYYPSPAEAQEFLDNYKERTIPLFPFIVIPPKTTAEVFRGKSPLLWKAVMMQGLHLHARRQVFMGEEVMRDIVTGSFIQPRKSLDLLQAIEVFVAWFHSSAKSFELTNLLYLMRSICVSLGFNESQEFSKQRSKSVTSLEQMRAFTGVYYLVTMIFTTNKKPDAFMNTTYLDHCCRILEEQMEYPSDRLVVLLVRTQQLSQSVSMTIAFRNNRDSLPLSLAIQSFQHEIRQLRSTVPDSLSDDVSLNTQMYIAETLLYEVAISDELSAGLAPADRLELLWKCLISARSALDARFKKPYNGWARSTSLASFDFTYAMLVCLTLSLLQLPGWDLRVVRKEFDFDKYLSLQIEDLKAFTSRRSINQHSLGHAGGAPGGASGSADFQDPYVRLHTRLSQLRICILTELAATLPPDPQQTNESEVSATKDASLGIDEDQRSGPAAEGMLGEPYADNFPDFDDVFWQDMFKPHEWDMNFSTLLGRDAGDEAAPNYTGWTGDG